MFKNLLNRLLPSPPAPARVEAPPPAPVTPPPAAPNAIADADAFIAQGNALEDAGQAAPAEALYRQAVAKAPGHARAHLNLGIVLADQGDAAGAAAAFEAVLAIDPRHPFGNYNFARLLVVQRELDRAETLVREALRAKPDFPQATELLSRVLRDQGFAHEALAPLRQVVERDPANFLHRSFELFVMNYVDDARVAPLHRRHVEFGAALEAAVPVRFERHPERGDPRRRLRVGYLSSDFSHHPVGFFMLPVLQHHDPAQVEVFCYSSDTKHDDMTDRLRAAAHQWRDVAALSDAELADAVHADGIDVLVDLIGHTGIPRLGVFCARPAPVQATWLGYLNTSGLQRMDFRLSDARCDPLAIAQPFHTERLVHLPASQWCYRRPDGDPAVDPVPPFERKGHVTFGAFNAAIKITPDTCRRWAQVLLRVPGSRLVVGDIGSPRKREDIRRVIEAEGVAGDRLTFLPRVPVADYLGLYNQVDISFDTFPYGGGTTTFDSLWMGAPVVAAVGELPVSRSAASVLAALGLDDWIAPSADDFVAVAVARAADRDVLRALRRELRPRLQASPLGDVPRFVRDLEAALRAMWLEKTR